MTFRNYYNLLKISILMKFVLLAGKTAGNSFILVLPFAADSGNPLFGSDLRRSYSTFD